MPSIEKRASLILQSFEEDHDWESRYRKIIQWGQKMEALKDSLKEDHLLVKGCQSKVWLLAQNKKGLIVFQGDSDALITKGLLSLMIYFYSGSSGEEILKKKPQFIESLDLLNHLTPSRSSGLGSLIQTMQNYAKAFLIIEKSKKKKAF